MNHTPAEILRAFLTTYTGHTFTVPANPVDAWPLYAGEMPDGPGTPDDLGVLYDTPGVIRSRLLASGLVVQSHGLQLMVRSLGYNAGWKLADNSAIDLSKVTQQTVTIGSDTYKIDTVRQTSPTVSLGQDERRRALCSVNFLLMLTTT